MHQLAEQVSGVPREEQERLAQEARAYYLKPSSKLCDPKNPSVFDRKMLGLFDAIERNDWDIDARIEDLRVYYKQESIWQQFKDRTKVSLTWRMVGAPLQRRDSKMGKTGGMWQLRCNWNRLALITNRWTTGLTIAPGWLGPAPLPPIEVEGPEAERVPYDPAEPPLWFKN